MTNSVAGTRTPAGVLRAAGLSVDAVRQMVARRGGTVSYADAMNLAAFYQRLVERGIAPEIGGALAVAMPAAAVAQPRDAGDVVVSFVEQATERGMESAAVVAATLAIWTKNPQRGAEIGGTFLRSNERGGVDRLHDAENPKTLSSELSTRERRSMAGQEKRNGFESERAELKKERERLERERERLEREREQLEKYQEHQEEELEREQERLEKLEEELEAREEKLDEREDDLEDLEELEVEGVEGVREVLDVVSERIPNLMRGIQETVYSSENLEKMAGAIASFYKKLIDAGIDEDQAAHMTNMQLSFMQSQSNLATSPLTATRRIRRVRPPRPSRPTEPAETTEPTEAGEEDED